MGRGYFAPDKKNFVNPFFILLCLLFFNPSGSASGIIPEQSPEFPGWLLKEGGRNSFQAWCSLLHPGPVNCFGSRDYYGHNALLQSQIKRVVEGASSMYCLDLSSFSNHANNPEKSAEMIPPGSPVVASENFNTNPQVIQVPELPEIPDAYRIELFRNQNSSTIERLRRAEALSFTSQVAGMAFLLSIDIWETGRRPLADWKGSLRRAWTTAPDWDDDDYEFNYIGHPYTGAFTYNLMRSQAASPLASWLFSCSQSLIWEFSIEALEEHPSMQDLLITSNLGSLIGEGFHRFTAKMRQNGLSLPEKIIVSIINPAHVLNNGYK